MAMRATVLCMVVFALIALAVSFGALRAHRGSPIAASCPRAPEARYFPVGTFRPDRNGTILGISPDLFVRQWYSKHLAAMEEPSLSCGAPEDIETYRFLWLRTFHNPIAVRVFRRSDDFGLEAVILGGAGGYDPGSVSRRVKKELLRDQWQTVIAKLERVRLWRMPTESGEPSGADGAQWIVEGRRDGRYHIVDRWTGSDDGLESIGKLFLDLAGLSSVGPDYSIGHGATVSGEHGFLVRKRRISGSRRDAFRCRGNANLLRRPSCLRCLTHAAPPRHPCRVAHTWRARPHGRRSIP